MGKHDKVYYYNWKERFAELGSHFQYCWATARCCTIIWNHKWYKGFALVMEANRKAHELYIPWKNTKPSKKQKGTSSTQKYQTGRDMLNVCIMSLSRDWFPRRYHWFVDVPWFGMTYHRTLPPTFSLDKYCNQQNKILPHPNKILIGKKKNSDIQWMATISFLLTRMWIPQFYFPPTLPKK